MKGSPCNFFFCTLFLQARDPTHSEFLLAHSVAKLFKTSSEAGSTSIGEKR